MELENLNNGAAQSAVGELVLQNGRQAGTRRPLGAPTTFIGRTSSCDIRLNVDGIDPLHCVLVAGPEGIVLRDLNSVTGSYVNGIRSENVALQSGDLLKVGPFQFRLELAPAGTKPQLAETTDEELRDSLRVQAAAVAAQQIALEEEEIRLENRKAALHQQEEQLTAHLAEKQRQVQLWSEYTKSEREVLRKEKLEHEKKMAKVEGELLQQQKDVENDHAKLHLERQHINKVYQRLRQRWQKQWSIQKEKYTKLAERHEADKKALADEHSHLCTREGALARDIVAFNTERELSTRQLQDTRDTLKKDQETWRKRRSLELTALNARRRDLEETQVKITQARQLLVHDKDAWTRQHNTLQAELHGINNRINHQRIRIQENEEKLARLDTLRREKLRPPLAEATPESPAQPPVPSSAPIECEVEILPDETLIPGQELQDRCGELERLAGELADQRSLLVEQYKRLAEIQQSWQDERSRASVELEALAQRLAADEQALGDRQQQASATEEQLQQRQAEIDETRREILAWRVQLQAREKVIDEEHQHELHELRLKETLLQEQLAAVAQLRVRWNSRRQAEIEQLQAHRSLVARAQKEAHEVRGQLSARGQKLGEEKRSLAEKALALEQYRQEVFLRANDPAATRRVERLRRRWMTLNAHLIGNAKSERDAVRQELARLNESHSRLLDQIARITQDETALAERQSHLDQRDVELNSRQMNLDDEIRKMERQRRKVPSEDVDVIAIEVYAEDDETPLEKAA